jgi:hypothetical protein
MAAFDSPQRMAGLHAGACDGVDGSLADMMATPTNPHVA